jgi:hypothetical protein
MQFPVVEKSDFDRHFSLVSIAMTEDHCGTKTKILIFVGMVKLTG